MEITSKTLDELEHEKERDNVKTLEAVFFVSGRFLTMPELISLSDLNPIAIRDLIEKLKEKYNRDDSAIEIVEKNGMWKMDVRQEFTAIINKLATGSSEFTKAEQETLAIIAYKQPMKQSIIIKIRGNKAYDHIKKFDDLGLIKKKRLGHTHELSLSDDFYDYFNVGENDSLREVAEMIEKKGPEGDEVTVESEEEETVDEENVEDKSDSDIEIIVEEKKENSEGVE